MHKNRIIGLEFLRAGDLEPDPRNWRTHPDPQRAALLNSLETLGYIDAVIVRRTEAGKTRLVDGHLRADLDPDAQIPALVVDLNEKEAGAALAMLDPIAALAEADREKLEALATEIRANEAVDDELLTALEELHGIEVDLTPPHIDLPEEAGIGDDATRQNNNLNQFSGPRSSYLVLAGKSFILSEELIAALGDEPIEKLEELLL